MRGIILGVHDGRGVLVAGDRRFEFPLTEWRSPATPSAGQAVDFVEDNGQARSVFAAPGGASAPLGSTWSGSMVLSAVAAGCFALGFIIPFLPHIIAFVLGVIAAGRAREENDETALLLARIAWIGSLVVFSIGVLAVLVIVTLFGAMGGFGWMLHGLGPGDF